MNHRPFPSPSGRPFFTGKHLSRRRSPQQLASSVVLVLFLFAGLLGNIVSAVPAVQAASNGKRPTPPAPASMTVQQFLKEGRKDHAYHGSLLRPKKVLTVPLSPKDTHANSLHLPPTAEPGKMQSISQPLDTSFTTSGATGKPLDLKGSDGRLEVQLQAGSLDLTHATVSGGRILAGSLTLQITQLHGHYYSQLNELGAYVLQVIDSKGQPVSGIVLRTPLTFIYHYQPTELQALNLDTNHILLTWPTLLLAARAAKQPTTALVTALKNDVQTHTLSGQSNVLGPGPFDLVSTPQVQAPPALLLAGVTGNNGQLSFSYPLQVPPGPAGFAPQLSLVYSSLAPNSRYSRTAPANDEGDGWSLTLGSITMDNYSSSSGAAAPGNWYFLNDVANVSDRMVPDSTSNFFQTQHISHLRIQQVTSGSTGQPCFNVWDTSGTYYQLGCTSDSLQYYNNSGTQTFYRWDVNKIIAPNDNNSAFKIILVSYFQDCVPSASPCASSSSVRDDGISQITYGTGTSTGSITTLAGTVDFHYHAPAVPSSQSQWATAYGNNYQCSSPPTTTTLRCDDPLNFGSVNAPTVMSTLNLDSVTSYVGSDSGNNAAYKYSLSYQNQPLSSNCYDPYSQTQEYCAGEHLLTGIAPSVYQSGTAHQLPGMTFSSSEGDNTYFDSQNTEQNSSTKYGGQTYWQYLTSYMNTIPEWEKRSATAQPTITRTELPGTTIRTATWMTGMTRSIAGSIATTIPTPRSVLLLPSMAQAITICTPTTAPGACRSSRPLPPPARIAVTAA